ncbi:ClpP/crotonase-like domain-containing protein [Mortierella sp. GBAus27b]|nr:ClpP/crotonase-like domain-containing protein [Mortierella sp. GBAus27b]
MSVAISLPVDPSKLVSVEREGPLFILTMVQEKNRFTPELCKPICDSLDSISATVKKEKMKEAALITRGTGKFYSNGLHVETALADPSFPERDFMPMVNKILLFGIPTVACIQGHAFAAGCLMAMAHDYRVMRGDRGVLCMSEVDLPCPIPTGLSALLRFKWPHHVYRSAVLEGKRYKGEDALSNHMVDAIADGEAARPQTRTKS